MKVEVHNHARVEEAKQEQLIFEIRTLRSDDGDEIIFEGYAAKFDKLSEDLGGFKEKIQKGAFKKSLEKNDIRALFNHDSSFVLGRNKADTLELKEDKTGLFMRVIPPMVQWVKDLAKSVERGDINQMSFGFFTVEDKWEEKQGSIPIRTLIEAALFDVSIVTFPAYKATSVALRSLEQWKKGGGDLTIPNPDTGDIIVPPGQRAGESMLHLARFGSKYAEDILRETEPREV